MPVSKVFVTKDNTDFIVVVSESIFNITESFLSKSTTKSKNNDGSYSISHSYFYKSCLSSTYSVKIGMKDGFILDSKTDIFKEGFVSSSEKTAE
jgi:hypothetical protein